MKFIPESSESLIAQPQQRLKIDTGALCFFSLGMFLAASLIHQFVLF